MKIVKGDFGECRFCDNMNPDFGLPSLKQVYDLCLTDPPYNLNFKGSTEPKNKKARNTRDNIKIWYEDNKPHQEYLAWVFQILDSVLSKTNVTIWTPGYKNFKDYAQYYFNYELVVFTDISAQGGCKVASFRKFEPVLVFNLENHRSQHNRLKFAWIDIKNEVNQQNYGDYKHPCPKNLELWQRFISEVKPTSVLDPFLGSGTTAEVCESLGIPWLGYEIMEEYAPDIEKRIHQGQKKYLTHQKYKSNTKQKTFMEFLHS